MDSFKNGRVVPDYVIEFQSWLMSHGQVTVIFYTDIFCCTPDVFQSKTI